MAGALLYYVWTVELLIYAGVSKAGNLLAGPYHGLSRSFPITLMLTSVFPGTDGMWSNTITDYS